MALHATLLCCLLPLAASQFIPPDAILQAGYPAGFRAFIPDFPGCELFGFHGKLNSPFLGDEEGMFSREIRRPQGDFWVFEDLNAVLTPGDIIHYWTMIVKDKMNYPKKNLTWKVPDPDESVDLLKPVTLRPPRPTPEKMRDTEPTTPTEDATTPAMETSPTSEESSPPSAEATESSTSPSTTTQATTTTTTTKATPTTKKTPPTTTTTPKPPTTKPKKSTSTNPLVAEDVEELTTPALPLDRPITGEFPEEPPLFPFPSPFPRPFKPIMPPSGPGFEICSNPWNFEERLGESRTQRLERQVAKLQCELAMFQRSYTQLGNTVENELTDLKKLIYGMVGRMARLESVIRSAAFG